ncbi:hypothetical protein D3C72_61720 [compost metagenome]
MHGCMWGYGPMGWGWFMMLLASLFWIAVLALIVVVIMRLWPGSSTFQSSTPREDEALSILRQRYARGEIDSEEFERKRRELLS